MKKILIYIDLFNNTDIGSVTDDYWKEALPFFIRLGNDEKKTFFKIIRQIEVDTMSNLLGILDGVSWLDDQEEDFKLTTENNDLIINGELQDLFLELEENNE